MCVTLNVFDEVFSIGRFLKCWHCHFVDIWKLQQKQTKMQDECNLNNIYMYSWGMGNAAIRLAEMLTKCVTGFAWMLYCYFVWLSKRTTQVRSSCLLDKCNNNSLWEWRIALIWHWKRYRLVLLLRTAHDFYTMLEAVLVSPYIKEIPSDDIPGFGAKATATQGDNEIKWLN